MVSDQTQADDKNSGPDIQHRINALENKIDKIDHDVGRRLSLWLGIGAIVISIVIGSYNIFDVFVKTPEREREAALEDLNQTLSSINDLNIKITEAHLSMGPQKAASLGQATNLSKIFLLSRADAVAMKNPSVVSYHQLFLMSTEHLNFGNVDQSIKYIEMAEKSQEMPPAFQVEAIRQKAKAVALRDHGNMAQARVNFRNALDIAKKGPEYMREPAALNVFSDWVSTEILYGECEQARKVAETFRDEASNWRQGLGFMRRFAFLIQQNIGMSARCQELRSSIAAESSRRHNVLQSK
jgi:hypothetical protein